MDLHFFDSNFNLGFYYVTLVGSRHDAINGHLLSVSLAVISPC
jgi:hypothetical protein